MARVELKVGVVSFSSEGDESWVQKQLEFFVEHMEKLREVAEAAGTEGDGGKTPPRGGARGTLAAFLKGAIATTNQRKKFLATAEWLHRGGATRLTTSDVVRALSQSHQPSISNPTQRLNDNVKQGHCEKEGKQFFVTDPGREELGIKVE